MKKKTKGRIEMGRRTCNWKEEDIKAIYVAKWAKKEGKQEEEWEYMIRTMKGDIGWIWEKEMIEYMGNNTKGGWGEEAEKIMEKLRSEHRMKMTAKGRIIGKEKEDDVNKKEEIAGEDSQRNKEKTKREEEYIKGDEGKNIIEALMKKRWNIGICGIITKKTRKWEIEKNKEGRENIRSHDTECDFITEYIAPGGGKGDKGAGTRMMAAMITADEKEGEEERGIHAHIYGRNEKGKTF